MRSELGSLKFIKGNERSSVSIALVCADPRWGAFRRDRLPFLCNRYILVWGISHDFD